MSKSKTNNNSSSNNSNSNNNNNSNNNKKKDDNIKTTTATNTNTTVNSIILDKKIKFGGNNELDERENQDLIDLEKNKPINIDEYEGLPRFEQEKQQSNNGLWNRLNNWFYEQNFNIMCSTLKNGPIPKHIGVIMDGNRRFAEKNHLETKEGHKKGFNTMLDLCQWGLTLGVKIISVYAFSIENFKRSKAEVDDLMELANNKFEEMISKSHKLQKLGVRIRVVGDYSRIPEKTLSILSKAVKATENNNRALLNICLSYTSHEEILHSMKLLKKGVVDQYIETDDIDQTLFENCMYIKEDLDVLIRTSGEYRLSDFMLWQSCFTNLAIVSILWPDFSFFHFIYIIFLFQFNNKTLKNEIQNQHQFNNKSTTNNNNTNTNNNTNNIKSNERVKEFINSLKENEDKIFENFIKQEDKNNK